MLKERKNELKERMFYTSILIGDKCVVLYLPCEDTRLKRLPFISCGVNTGSKLPSQTNASQDIAQCFEKGNATKRAHLCGACLMRPALTCVARFLQLT